MARLQDVKILGILFVLLPLLGLSQDYTEEKLITRLTAGENVGEGVLSRRSVVLYSYTLTEAEIKTVHENLVQTGIDAVAYFEVDKVLGGRDMTKGYSDYFIKREIINFVFVLKSNAEYSIYVTAFNNGSDLVSQGQAAWTTRSQSLKEALTTLYRSALSSNKPKNFLINDVPETDLPVALISGRRSELYAYDLKIDKLAVLKFGDEVSDKALDELIKTYPFPNQLINPGIPEADLRKQGFLYVLCYVHTRSSAAKNILGYPVNASESAFVSVTFPDGQVQLRNIPASTSVYKFYVRHIDSGNVFLGTKWDADTTWQQALKNFIAGFKAELKIN